MLLFLLLHRREFFEEGDKGWNFKILLKNLQNCYKNWKKFKIFKKLKISNFHPLIRLLHFYTSQKHRRTFFHVSSQFPVEKKNYFAATSNRLKCCSLLIFLHLLVNFSWLIKFSLFDFHYKLINVVNGVESHDPRMWSIFLDGIEVWWW